jgi:hypothetical protein
VDTSKYKDLVDSYTDDIKRLWEFCNMHSFEERIKYYTLIEVHKTVFRESSSLPAMREWYIKKTLSRSNRYEGAFDTMAHNSESYKHSFRYRSIHLWNDMIKDGSVFSDDYCKFRANVALYVMNNEG